MLKTAYKAYICTFFKIIYLIILSVLKPLVWTLFEWCFGITCFEQNVFTEMFGFLIQIIEQIKQQYIIQIKYKNII